MSMTDRERDFENRFVHDQEMRFRIEARRNRLVGLWAAQLLNMSGENAETYAQTLVEASVVAAGRNDLFGRIRADFDRERVSQSDHQIRRTLEEKLAEAETQIMAE